MKDDRELARHGDRDAMTVAILMFAIHLRQIGKQRGKVK